MYTIHNHSYSRKLTYPLQKVLLKLIFLFPFGGISASSLEGGYIHIYIYIYVSTSFLLSIPKEKKAPQQDLQEAPTPQNQPKKNGNFGELHHLGETYTQNAPWDENILPIHFSFKKNTHIFFHISCRYSI